MKRISILSAIAALAIFATSCSKDVKETGTQPVVGEKGLVQLTLSTATASQTRAGVEGDSEASATELKVNAEQGLSIVVFNENGSFNYGAQNVALTATGNADEYKAAPIEVNAGNLYFFVFANNGAGKITIPTSGNIDDFMTSLVTAGFTGNALDIATADNFLLGSMWRQWTLTAAGGTAATPTQVTIPSIGRLSSKIALGTVTLDKTAESTLKGTFSDATYRPGTVAKAINYVGVHAGTLYDGTDRPYGANTGVLVTSAKHTAPYELTAGQGDFNATDFIVNTAFTFLEPTETFYITENTTARNATTGLQYYGNTTYIQIKTVYTPDESEIYDLDGTTLGTLTDGDFWTAVKDDVRLIYNADPSAVEGISDVKFFDGGVNYHKFPVQDQNETDDLMKNRVLRNHHYTFDVTGINDLGEPTETVNPDEPIVTKTTVEITVKVADWDKVTGSIEL